jgi:hypothetical protein
MVTKIFCSGIFLHPEHIHYNEIEVHDFTPLVGCYTEKSILQSPQHPRNRRTLSKPMRSRPMPTDKSANSIADRSIKPMGWLVGLGVLLITLSVVFGVIGVGLVAKRKQVHRINDAATESNMQDVSRTNVP